LFPTFQGADAAPFAGGDEAIMKLTRAASYALHAVTYMAAQKKDSPIASHIIADARDIPERFLLKVLKPLVSARVLRSVKGPNGGYRLARAPRDITLLEILEAVDGPIRGQAPFAGESGNGNLNHKLEVICRQMANQNRKHLEKVRVTDLMGGKHK
jgi:Rrf2 family protein